MEHKKRKLDIEQQVAPSAEEISKRIGCLPKLHVSADGAVHEVSESLCVPEIHYLSTDQQSWIIYVPNAVSCSSENDFQKMWDEHPQELGSVVLMGKEIQTQRYTQSYGRDYYYSGQNSTSKPINSNPAVNSILLIGQKMCPNPFNQCLVNWYEPNHHIGLHSDNQIPLVDDAPIFSVSWGHRRRFRLTSKDKENASWIPNLNLFLEDGDVVIMGGKCQKTHKHAVPPLGKKEIATAKRRINFTLRCFKT